jgi:hypothetical protein
MGPVQINISLFLSRKTNNVQVIDLPRKNKLVTIARVILGFSGFIALILAYFVWTQPIETLKILVALNFFIAGLGQILRAVYFPKFED